MNTAALNQDTTSPSPDSLRAAALEQLRKRRDFRGHLIAFVMVNLLLNAIWLSATPGGFYWPMFPLFGWGIGVVFNAWDVYSSPPREDKIQREIQRLSRR